MTRRVAFTLAALFAVPALLQAQVDKPDAKTLKLIQELGGRVRYEENRPRWFAQVPYTLNRKFDLDRIQKLPRLEMLCLATQDLTDDDLRKVVRMGGLRMLDLRCNHGLTATGLSRLCQLPRLEELRFSLLEIDVKALKPGWLPAQLRTLELTSTNITDDGLKSLANLKQLEHLDLSGDFRFGSNGITDKGLKQLRQLKSLRSLDLTGNSINGAGLHELEHLPNLSVLVIGSAQNLKDFSGLAKLTQLSELRLDGVSLGPNDLQFLQSLTGLRTLSLESANLQDDYLSYLVAMQRLETLNLSGTPIGDAGLKHLRSLRSLKKLDLSNTRVTAKGLQQLESLDKLEELTVDSNVVLANLQAVTKLPIRSLTIEKTQLSKDDWTALRKMSHLRELDLCCLILSDDTWKQIRELKQVESIASGERDVRDADLAHVAKMPNVKSLIIHRNPITDRGLQHLAAMNQLETLIVIQAFITDAGLKHLRGCRKLKSLTLNGIGHPDYTDKITDAGLAHLAQLTALEDLHLSGHGDGITDIGLSHLQGLKRLAELHIDSKKVTKAAVAKLTIANPRLTIERPSEEAHSTGVVSNPQLEQ